VSFRPPSNEVARILSALVEGRRLTRFGAEQLGDHCLPSTVSAIKKYGIVIQRELVEREGRRGRFHCLARRH
jgi:hypothetical protein